MRGVNNTIDEAVGPVDIERMTGLPIDQLLDVTACAWRRYSTVTRSRRGRPWTSSSPSIVTVLYLRQNQTEDFIAAIFDVSQATVLPPADNPRDEDRGCVGGPETRPGRR